MTLRHSIVGLIFALGAASCDSTDHGAQTDIGTTTSLLTASPAANRYIVVMKRGTSQASVAGRTMADVAAAVQKQHGGTVYRVYQHALEGMAMELSDSELATLRADSRVAYIEPDGVVTANDTQNNPGWDLDRVDQRNLPLSASYTYPTQAGAGVHVYVLDTGINATHTEFAAAGGGSRVGVGTDFIDNDSNPDDCNGHGTHVAGTVGGTTYGVAKKATLHAVRVLDCFGNGTVSGAIAGIDYVTANHTNPAVANMSLSSGFVQSFNDAVTNAIAAGITFAVAASNNNSDACGFSPSSTPNAITVGSTNSADTRASDSNFGTCLDLFAQGVGVTSAWIGSNTATNILSGTSMASPHVAGAAALYLGLNPSATPATVAQQLVTQATPNLVIDPQTGSPNRLLYMGFLNTAPASPCTGLCTNPTNITINGSFQSGNLGTGAVCYQTTSVVHGGNCGNFVSPRTLKVNGVTETCNNINWSSIPAARNGGYCVQTTAGNQPWAYVTLF